MLAHSIRSYYGATQLLDVDGEPFWVVNEGEYRMMNTLDLTIDQSFYELTNEPVDREKRARYVRAHGSATKIRSGFPETTWSIPAASALRTTWAWPTVSRSRRIRPTS